MKKTFQELACRQISSLLVCLAENPAVMSIYMSRREPILLKRDITSIIVSYMMNYCVFVGITALSVNKVYALTEQRHEISPSSGRAFSVDEAQELIKSKK